MKKEGLFYIDDCRDLFEEVQKKRVFADQKFFPDCIPQFPVEEILKEYHQSRRNAEFDLKSFCATHFRFPVETSNGFSSDPEKPVEEHISALWEVLTRQPSDTGGTLIRLPRPFIVPGGRFREIYYWDSYFTMLGLQVSGKTDLIESMTDNFAYLIDSFGFIPNGNRTYFLSRSQPPFFSLMIELLAEEKGKEALLKYAAPMEKEYDFWMLGKEDLAKDNHYFKRVVLMPDGELLNRYWDELNRPREEAFADDLETAGETSQNQIFREIRAAAESGWDFSSRWFRDPQSMSSIHTTDVVPVDLNCLLYKAEKMLSRIYELKQDTFGADRFRQLSLRREEAIQKYCWNPAEGLFMDFDLSAGAFTGSKHAACTFPLFLHIATPSQAKKVSVQLKDKFLKEGGVVTTLVHNGQQWDAPNGWAPLQWTAYRGLKDYQLDEVADHISENWLGAVERIFHKRGKITEKYDVVNTFEGASGGEYPNQDGFGWTNGVYLKMKSFKA
jgi:alpha,alpha-trehalase